MLANVVEPLIQVCLGRMLLQVSLMSARSPVRPISQMLLVRHRLGQCDSDSAMVSCVRRGGLAGLPLVRILYV